MKSPEEWKSILWQVKPSDIAAIQSDARQELEEGVKYWINKHDALLTKMANMAEDREYLKDIRI